MSFEAGLKEKIVLGLLVFLLIVGVIWRAAQVAAPTPEIIQAGHIEEEAFEDAEPELIIVHLAGAVNKPGVYHLPAGSRVYELLETGGGFSEDADYEALNQARPLLDGEQIYVHRAGESRVNGSPAASSKININHATASELTALPGIGDVRAEQIVHHREKHGFFSDPIEIMDVSGIGEATFNNIAEMITVY